MVGPYTPQVLDSSPADKCFANYTLCSRCSRNALELNAIFGMFTYRYLGGNIEYSGAVPNAMAIHPITVDLFQSGLKWRRDVLTNHTTLPSLEPRCKHG